MVCVGVFIGSFVSTGCMYHEYDRWTGDTDIKMRHHHFTNFRFGFVLAWQSLSRSYGRSKSASVCMGWVWLSCQLAICVMNTTYALATEWWFWYQPATLPFNTNRFVCLCVLAGPTCLVHSSQSLTTARVLKVALSMRTTCVMKWSPSLTWVVCSLRVCKWFMSCSVAAVNKLKSIPSHKGPHGGADLRFCSHLPDTSWRY